MCEIDGWVSLHKKFMLWEWYDDMNTKALFIHCLLKANYSFGTWHGIEIERGSFVTSIEKLANELHLSKQQIKTAIKKLQKTKELATRATNNYTMVTVLKYNTYQDNKQTEQPTNNQRATNEQPTNNQRITTTNKNNKNNKNNKKENTADVVGYYDQLYQIFKTEYFNAIGIEYTSTTENKDKMGISKLAKLYKEKNPERNTEQALSDFQIFFSQVASIDDKFTIENLNPMYIASNIAKIKVQINKGNYGKSTKSTNSTKSTTEQRLSLTNNESAEHTRKLAEHIESGDFQRQKFFN